MPSPTFAATTGRAVRAAAPRSPEEVLRISLPTRRAETDYLRALYQYLIRERGMHPATLARCGFPGGAKRIKELGRELHPHHHGGD